MFRLDIDAARALLAGAVETQGPGFVYNPDGDMPCHYLPLGGGWKQGDPRTVTGCLIGTALKDIPGVAAELHTMRSVRLLIEVLAERGILEATTGAVLYLMNAQAAQDWGHSWGQAYGLAEDAYETVIKPQPGKYEGLFSGDVPS